jgi:ABC-2 type transport system ATP-binding protein
LILDEPTVGLDPKQIIEIRDLIKSLAGSHSVILSTHILPEATAVCQRVVIISGGRIVAEDTPDQLSARLRHSEKISVTIKTPPDNCLTKLQSISGILNVFQGQSAGTFLLECALGQDKRDEVARFIIANQWGLLELRTISMTLEDVFLQLTRHEEGMTPQTDQLSSEANYHKATQGTRPHDSVWPCQRTARLLCPPVVYVVGAIFLLIFGFLSYLYVVYAGYQAIQIMQMQGGQAQLT